MLVSDYHTHTTYSHGKGSVLDNAKAAQAKGLKEIAITDHGFNHMAFGIKRKEIPLLRVEIDNAEEKTGVKIYLGVEANICTYEGDIDIVQSDLNSLEFLIVGFHKYVKAPAFKWFSFIFGNILANYLHIFTKKRIIQNTQAYVKAVKKYPIDILAHLNHICKVDCYEVAKACEETDTYIELNGKRVHFTQKDVDDMLKTNVKFVINSDAHTAGRVGDQSIGMQMAEIYGIPKDRIINLTQTIKPKDKKVQI